MEGGKGGVKRWSVGRGGGVKRWREGEEVEGGRRGGGREKRWREGEEVVGGKGEEGEGGVKRWRCTITRSTCLLACHWTRCIV